MPDRTRRCSSCDNIVPFLSMYPEWDLGHVFWYCPDCYTSKPMARTKKERDKSVELREKLLKDN